MVGPFGVFVAQSQICERGGIAPVVLRELGRINALRKRRASAAACCRKQTLRANTCNFSKSCLYG
jgi:hypothetical protein